MNEGCCKVSHQSLYSLTVFPFPSPPPLSLSLSLSPSLPLPRSSTLVSRYSVGVTTHKQDANLDYLKRCMQKLVCVCVCVCVCAEEVRHIKYS